MIDLGRGRGRLNNDAALSVARLDALNPRGYLSINSAYRSDAEQQVLVDRWNAGGKYNRPPYLYEPARVGKSPHRTGRALDTSDIDFMLTTGYDHGWRRTYDYDKPHFEYFAQYDNHKESPLTEKEIGMIEKLIQINGKVYGVGFGLIKHIRDDVQLTDLRNIRPDLKTVELTDNRCVEAFGQYLDANAIDPLAIDPNGYVLDPFDGSYKQGNAWSEERATRAELRALAERIK